MMPLCRLVVLGLKHFEGTPHSEQLMSSYLLRKSQWSIKKHIRETAGRRASSDGVLRVGLLTSRSATASSRRDFILFWLALQTFLSQRAVPPLPLACSRVHPGDQRPPVDKTTCNMPNWLKVRATRAEPHQSRDVLMRTSEGGSVFSSEPLM